jgi:peptidoglycan/xylan/chitin deacetylase (PgdA/CDA1 family)
MKRCLYLLTLSIFPLPVFAAIILQYHHVDSSTPYSTSVSPAQFVKHLELIKTEGFEVVSLQTLTNALQQHKTLPDNQLAITFDDGYQDIYNNAYPELKKRGWPFSVFISPTPILAGYGDAMSWQQLQEMASHGADILNHSHSHQHLVYTLQGESEKQWLTRIQRDVDSAQQEIQQYFPSAAKILAYPYGEYNVALQNLLRSMGYIGIGQQSGPLHSSSDLLALPRYPASGAYGELSSLREKLRTRGFNLLSINPLDTVLTHQQKMPVLTIELQKGDFLPSQVQCYASGQGAINTQVRQQGEMIIIQAQATRPLPEGRSRYNCTAPALDKKGIYYWFSHPWLRKSAQDGWPAE